MQSLGTVATGAVGERGIPLPTAPRQRPAVDLVDRIAAKKAHEQALRIPIAPKPPTAEHQCKACGEWVHKVSRRGWCDWCEQQAAAAIAPAEEIPDFIPADTGPEPVADIPAKDVPPNVSQDGGPVELPDYILDFAILMRDTEGHDDAQVRAARKATANAAMTLHRIFTGWQKRQQQAAKPKRPRGHSRRPIDPGVVDAMIRLYTGPEQLSAPQIAKRLGVGTATVQRYITASGVPRRDDRHGGNNRIDVHNPALVTDVTHRYVDQQQTTTEIAAALHMSSSTISRVLKANGVTLRAQVARFGADHAQPLKERMTRAGVTSADVRSWARTNGIDIPDRGLPPASILNAYLEQAQP